MERKDSHRFPWQLEGFSADRAPCEVLKRANQEIFMDQKRILQKIKDVMLLVCLHVETFDRRGEGPVAIS